MIFYILFTSGSAGILNKILFSGTYRMMAQEAVRRVDSLLAEASVVEDAPARIPDRNDVEFRDVTFTYPGSKAPALSHPVSYTHLDVYKRQLVLTNPIGNVKVAGHHFGVPLHLLAALEFQAYTNLL